jgi:hypothetical protein
VDGDLSGRAAIEVCGDTPNGAASIGITFGVFEACIVFAAAYADIESFFASQETNQNVFDLDTLERQSSTVPVVLMESPAEMLLHRVTLHQKRKPARCNCKEGHGNYHSIHTQQSSSCNVFVIM